LSLDHILLGILRNPASGYDLKQEFERTARHFWFAELSQIYPALRKLEERGLLRSRRVPSSRGPERRVYGTTEAGSDELESWLRSDPVTPRPRITYLAQLFFMSALEDLEATERFMETLHQSTAEVLARLEQTERVWLDHLGVEGDPLETIDDDRVFHQYTTLRSGLGTLRARVEWCDETLAAIRARRERADRMRKSVVGEPLHHGEGRG
jgi:DNA-binding PadR family transcriptional regulator